MNRRVVANMDKPSKHLAYKYIDESVHPARHDLLVSGDRKIEEQRSFLCWFKKRYPEWAKKQRLRISAIQFRNWQRKCEVQDRKAQA